MPFLRVFKLIVFVAMIFQIAMTSLYAENISTAEQSSLKEMIESPQKYHSEIEDITKGHPSGHGMTSEMMKFYTAVAIVESVSCTVNNDPTGCEMFFESLKDPMGHVGFMAFMISARKTTEWSMMLSHGKIHPLISGNLGLVVGVLVQDLLIEIIKDPLLAELLTLAKNDKYPTVSSKLSRANEIKNLLWKKTFGSSEWRGDKTASIISLIAAASLSGSSQAILAAGGSAALKFGKHITKGRKVLKVGYKLGKVVRIGSTAIRSVTPIGVAISGLVIFLEWANVTEKYIGHPMRERNAIFHRALAQREIESYIQASKDISEKARDLSIKYFKERAVAMEPAVKILSGFDAKLDQMSKEFYEVTKYHGWLAKGMPKDEYISNEKEWHSTIEVKDVGLDRPQYIERFFCGDTPQKSIKVQKEINGIPVPFKEYDVSDYMEQIFKEIKSADASEANIRGIKIHPYKAFHVDGVCLEDIKKLNKEKFDSITGVGKYQDVVCPIKSIGNSKYKFEKNTTSFLKCQINQLALREDILETGKLKNKDIRKILIESNKNAMVRLMEKYETLRMSYIKRYEKRVYKTLLEHLTGQKFKILNYKFTNDYGVNTSVYYDTKINCSMKYFVIESNIAKPNFAGIDLEPDYGTDYLKRMSCEGSIPGLYQEIDYLSKLNESVENNEHKNAIETILNNANMQMKYALKVKGFYEIQLSERARVPEFELMFDEGDWVDMANFYENFILNE